MNAQQILYTDALGLCITPNSIITAIGNQWFRKSVRSSTKLPQGVRYKKVHGVAVNDQSKERCLLLFYCENEFSLYKYESSQTDRFQLLYEGETKDWINAATFLKDKDCCQYVLHMAHSTILRIQYDETENVGGKRGNTSILELAYCTDFSLLYCTTLNGDRFNELIVISGNGFGEILIWQPNNPIHSDVSTICGKEYPLRLRMKIHDGVIFSISLNLIADLLVTTSDDRSLKFWKLAKQNYGSIWDAKSLKPMFTCFGHKARVFCCTIADYADKVFVISGGEDSNICVWSISGDMLYKRRRQFGAPIWRLAFDPATAILYTAGSTGNILAYNLQSIFKKNQGPITKLMSIDPPTEYMQKVKFLNGSTIIGLSNKNRMLYMKISKQSNTNDWKLVSGFPVYKCTVLTVCNDMIATCGFRRVTLLSYNFNTENFQQLYDGTMLSGCIQSFHFLSESRYLISDEFGNCLILKGYELCIEASFKIDNCREPWITTALLVPLNCVLISTRNGYVFLYKQEATIHAKLKLTLKRLYKNMGATMFQLLKVDDTYAYLLSAGHESDLKYLQLNLNDHSITVLRCESIPLAWVEAAPAIDLFIGFNDNHLVVWSRQHDVLLQLHCGGGHRCWDYQLSNDELQIIYVKHKQLLYHREFLNNCLMNSLSNKWHTRSCNIMQIINQTNDIIQPYFVSAGEDNIIKIHKLSDKSFHQCAELHTHISSVRHLTLYPIKSENNMNYWLIFSVGGRSQLCINQFDPNGPFIKELYSHTLRSNDSYTTIQDARLMAINVLENSKTNEFSLYVASADGRIRLFLWMLENASDLCLLHLMDIGRCPLQLRLFDKHKLLLISTTNGMLYGFDHTLRTKHFEIQMHACGINAFDALIDEQFLHIVSGGDDENINYIIIKLTDMSIKRIIELSGLHNAQVNALILQKSTDATEQATPLLFAYTCSLDKQIFKVNLKTLQHNSLGYTCLSDIKGIILDDNQQLYIYGCGLQVMTVRIDSINDL